MRTALVVLGAVVLLIAGSESQAQGRDTSAAALVVPQGAKVKGKAETRAAQPARMVRRDSTAKPQLPRKSKSAPAPARETELPAVTKPPKSPA